LRLPLSAVRVLENRYQLPRSGSLFFRLLDAGVDQAHAVLTLLHAEEDEAVGILIGRSITICPACLTRRFEPSIAAEVTPDDLRIVSTVSRNPRLPTTPSFQRFAAIKPGMSVAQLLRRGVRRRDIREWSEEGTIQLVEKRA
jgi:hypothetical protein